MDVMTDWLSWHSAYDDPSSPLSERLSVVQTHIQAWLDETAPSPVTVVSSCAGDGRDLLDVLARRGDAERVTATLIEADARNADRARDQVARLGLSAVNVRSADAGASDAYKGAAPADMLMLCGIFGNISDEDVSRTIAAAPQLCTRGALVIWTRHRREPDLTPRVRKWFESHGFIEEAFVAPDHANYSVGVHRYVEATQPLVLGQRLFTFVR